MAFTLTTLQGLGRTDYDVPLFAPRRHKDRNYVKRTRRTYHTLVIKLVGMPDPPESEVLSGDELGAYQRAYSDLVDAIGFALDGMELAGLSLGYDDDAMNALASSLGFSWGSIWKGIKKVGSAFKTVGKKVAGIAKTGLNIAVPGAGTAIDVASKAISKVSSAASKIRDAAKKARDLTDRATASAPTRYSAPKSKTIDRSKFATAKIEPSANRDAASADRAPASPIAKLALPALLFTALKFIL